MLQELRAHVDDIAGQYDVDGNEIRKVRPQGEDGPTRALIITSEVDGVFCAGADLKERATFTPEMYVFVSIFGRSFVLFSLKNN